MRFLAYLAVLAVGVGLGLSLARAPDPGPVSLTPSKAFTCSMHPEVRSHEPGDCPICGMPLVPVGGSEEDTATVVRLGEGARIRARIRTAVATIEPIPLRELRLLGRIAVAEDRLATVTSWVAGRIDRLGVSVTGERVRPGQWVARLYAPELFTAERALQVSMQGGAPPGTVAAARRRLELLGVTPKELRAIGERTKPRPNVPVRALEGGVVMRRLVTPGAWVRAGAALLEIADLSRLWVELDAYEKDLPLIRAGQKVRMGFDAHPHHEVTAEVVFVDPVIDLGTRTAKVRVILENEDGRYRPGEFVEAAVAVPGQGEVLTIPPSAPLFAGSRTLVYVEQDDRLSYEAREVRLGRDLGDRWEVVAGLAPGDRVVVEGAFVLDADLQIRGGRSLMRGSGGPSSRPASQPSSHPASQPSSQPATQPSSQPATQPSFRPASQPSSRPAPSSHQAGHP